MLTPNKLYEIKLENAQNALSNFVILGKNSEYFSELVEDLKDAFDLIKLCYSRKENSKKIKIGTFEYEAKGKLKALAITSNKNIIKGIFGFGEEQVEMCYDIKNHTTFVVDCKKNICCDDAILEILLAN